MQTNVKPVIDYYNSLIERDLNASEAQLNEFINQ